MSAIFMLMMVKIVGRYWPYDPDNVSIFKLIQDYHSSNVIDENIFRWIGFCLRA